MAAQQSNILLLQEMTRKLERISADSHWARRASGVRGALLRYLTAREQGMKIYPDETIAQYIAYAERVLLKAAQEL